MSRTGRSRRRLPLALLLGGLGLPACQAPPVIEHQARLTEIVRVEPGIRLDLRYATPRNFTGRPLYPIARAYLLPAAAAALGRAHRSLAAEGYGLLVYDAYRPWHITKALWDAASESDRRQGYVADPDTGSRHNRGCAVDVGLYDLTTGREVPMPSAFDDFSVRAHADWPGANPATRRTRALLRQAMAAQGYTVLANEWWHFNYRDCDRQPLLDIPLTRAGQASP